MYRSSVSIVALVASLLAYTPSFAEVDSGEAEIIPWSGYWWPLREGGLEAPLAQYDQATGRSAASWERERLAEQADAPRWHGYCHAWAAASVLEAQPIEQRMVPGASDKPIALTVADQKGMLTGAHSMDVANVYGDRFGDGIGSEDPNDLSPDYLWELLQMYVRDQRTPLILDVENGPEVWNFPVCSYSVRYTPAGPSEPTQAQMELLLADDGVAAGFVGTQTRRLVYHFSFRLLDGAIEPGSAQWTGVSQQDHPDFAWYPFVVVAENPEIEYETVRELVGCPLTESTENDAQYAVSQTQIVETTDSHTAAEVNETQAEEAAPHVSHTVSPSELVDLYCQARSDFVIDATVDRFDGGTYRVGDTLRVSVASERAGYLYLLQLDVEGSLTLLYPQPGDDNRIPAQDSVWLPRAGAGYIFQAGMPAGVDRIKAVVTTQPLAFTGLNASLAGSGEGRGVAAPQAFRWHPTQRQVLHKQLETFHQKRAAGIQSQQTPKFRDYKTRIGAIGVDEVVFIVKGDDGEGVSVQASSQAELARPPK